MAHFILNFIQMSEKQPCDKHHKMLILVKRVLENADFRLLNCADGAQNTCLMQREFYIEAATLTSWSVGRTLPALIWYQIPPSTQVALPLP